MPPSRREEIKKKQELQARFQFSISQNNARAMNWLKPSTSNGNDASTTKESTHTGALTTSPETDSVTASSTQDDFMKLRVIPQGSGLSSKTTQTVGDFLNSKDISQQKSNSDGATSNGSTKSKGSVAMNALLNKMRNETRQQLNQSRHTTQLQSVKGKRDKLNGVPVSSVKGASSSTGAKGDKTLTKKSFDDDEGEDDEDDDIKALKSRSVNKFNQAKVGKGKKVRPF
ncbi:hypothetical protein KGF57_004878 [Candida theae]|uniref:Uncharacterized protein n=1 Tax=Candida theae TaxID=1198502 RepID=A0AAD5FWL8_9ASCO|nr:uncharacterized protein KGF57_004878 [Candida theae]KAI5949048.1 hypothetical protein KGF57_004878 [Candida theae]